MAPAGGYPVAAARAGQEGWVLLRFSIDAEGCVTEVAVADASPPGYFEGAVIAPFIDHCFTHPLIVDGEPVAAVDYPFLATFLLED